MEEQDKSRNKKMIILIFILFAILIFLIAIYFSKNTSNNNTNIANTSFNTNITQEEQETEININNEFDYAFLKLENKKENKVYSPLSIKYALKMLEEASNGETKLQISKMLGDKTLTKYTSNSNFSLSNALFVRDSFSNQIKESYIDTLKNKYNAELKFDSFENAKSINNWINNKTFEIIPQIASDEDVKILDFALINALAIDMEWEEKFILLRGYPSTEYLHEKRNINLDKYEDSVKYWEEYEEKGINIYDIENVSSNSFNNENSELKVSGMNIYASINNYDIINELGKDNIKNIVSEEYRKFAKGEEYDTEHAGGDFPLSEDVSDNGIQTALEEFFPTYFEELNGNYHKSGTSTDFSIYVDDEVKIFAKDLKEYNDTTLQYVGIMPTSVELDKFIENINSEKIGNYISNLKDIDSKNFKEGVVTRIYGYIPKFKFEYDLDLIEDLKSCNITNVFDSEKADLSNMINGPASINKVLHKANIEFTQDGIKAAAATLFGGAGGGEPFDYIFDVPVEEIDMTFNNPYMFLVIDKETKEIFFVGTVYEPLLWEDEPERINVD